MDATLLARLARQHAQTSRLLGVDFVPAYVTGMTKRPTPVADEPPAQAPRVAPPPLELRPDAPASHAQGAPVNAPLSLETHDDDLFGLAEPKPLRSGAPSDPDARATPTAPLTPRAASIALDALRERYVAEAPHARFIKSFTNIVFGEGDPRAGLCFVGEAPGEEEDRQGRPFVGRAGQLLDKMIAAMGLSRERVYICNVLKVRPPDNATPTPEEAEASRPYLLEQLDIIAPEVIVTLGKSASQCLLRCTDTMGAMRGSWRQLRLPSSRTIAVMPTFHPAYLLRSYTEENRKMVWSDLKLAMGKLTTKRDA